MKKGIIGKKLGMTQIFMEDGSVIPVTVIEAGPCPVTQKKTAETDGYEAVQLAFEETDNDGTLLWGDIVLAEHGVCIGGNDIFAELHGVCLVNVAAGGIVQVQDRLFVLCRKAERKAHAVLHRCDRRVLGDQRVHVLLDDLLNETGNVLEMVIKGIPIDPAVLHDAAHTDLGQRHFSEQFDKRRFDRLLCKVGHDILLCPVLWHLRISLILHEPCWRTYGGWENLYL